ncbi:hypothetical protein HOLleu_22153 [Holothuria leucospilota]|uniref:Uncharacterized protein n=1 Tax=Holothuria leucospilota TaxID=206669 RepID=A0A9Q1BYH4_HOLLE|nr:hypothetical protein HOLleu_22153 [Holothuria leucospilota]
MTTRTRTLIVTPSGLLDYNKKKCPPQVNELKAFEEDLIRMTENIQYRKVNNSFLSSLRSDAAKINASGKVYVFADKTRNLYKLDKASYEKLFNENSTAKYKRAKDDTMDVIANDLFKIADKLDVSDKIDTMTVKQAFITLKDHKDSFAAKPSYRLINPAKSEMGKVSKVILDTINTKIRSMSKVNQWRNTLSVIDWFRHIPDKNRCTFVVFDIVDFYPSISSVLQLTALSWAKTFTNITQSNTSFKIQWNILKRIPTRMTAHGQCNLCTKEKLAILSADKASLLNKRSEIVSKCRHSNRRYTRPANRRDPP